MKCLKSKIKEVHLLQHYIYINCHMDARTDKQRVRAVKEEKIILEAVNLKKTEGWKNLYQRYYQALCVYVNKLLKGEDGAEDIVQDIIKAIWDSEKKFADIEELTRYLYGACYKNVIMFFRNKQIHDCILEKVNQEKERLDDDAYSQIVQSEVIRQLYAFIDELSTEQRKVLLLNMEGFSWEEIARKLGVSVNTAKTHRSRAINTLRTKFKKLYLFFFCL